MTATYDLNQQHREGFLEIGCRHGARDVRVFGSVARGDAGSESNIDFLIGLEPGRTLIDLSGLLLDLRELLSSNADVVTERSLHWFIRDQFLEEAVSA